MKYIFLVYIILPILTMIPNIKGMEYRDDEYFVTGKPHTNARGKKVDPDVIDFNIITPKARNVILKKVATLHTPAKKSAFAHDIDGFKICFDKLSDEMKQEIVTLEFSAGMRHHFHSSEVHSIY